MIKNSSSNLVLANLIKKSEFLLNGLPVLYMDALGWLKVGSWGESMKQRHLCIIDQ